MRSSSSAEEWLRRMQTVCFSPLAMLNAWVDGTKPWSFHEVKDQFMVGRDILVAPVASLTGEKLPVTVRHYGDRSSSYSLYDDDGTTFDYERGGVFPYRY